MTISWVTYTTSGAVVTPPSPGYGHISVAAASGGTWTGLSATSQTTAIGKKMALAIGKKMALNWELRIDKWYAKAGDKEYCVRSGPNGFVLKVCAAGDNHWEHLGLFISAAGAMGSAEAMQ